MVWRVLIFLAIGLVIYLGISKIWRDWTCQFKFDDEETRRLRRERKKPGIIDFKRDQDGRFRPDDDDERR
ncbi:MAG: hypothetical protein MO846_07940 [Candidatus Devosia symbiotica]|nr:hypothetical protein [Candidatus Devosia symbiotica]